MALDESTTDEIPKRNAKPCFKVSQVFFFRGSRRDAFSYQSYALPRRQDQRKACRCGSVVMASFVSMLALNSLQKSEGDCLSWPGSRDPKNTSGATMVDVGWAAMVNVKDGV